MQTASQFRKIVLVYLIILHFFDPNSKFSQFRDKFFAINEINLLFAWRRCLFNRRLRKRAGCNKDAFFNIWLSAIP